MDWGECGLGRCAIVGRIPYWGCKSNLCGADLEGGGASNLTGADRGRMWIGAVSPASLLTAKLEAVMTAPKNSNFQSGRREKMFITYRTPVRTHLLRPVTQHCLGVYSCPQTIYFYVLYAPR